MKLQDKLSDKRESFRVSIRRSHNEGMKRRHRVEIQTYGDYKLWFEKGMAVLAELGTLTSDESSSTVRAEQVLGELTNLLVNSPDAGQQPFLATQGYVALMKQIGDFLQRHLSNRPLLAVGFHVMVSISDLAYRNKIQISTDEVIYNPSIYLQEDVVGGYVSEYLSLLGNILIIDKSHQSITHLLQRGITSGLLRLFRSQELLECLTDSACWLLRLIFKCVLDHKLQQIDPNLPKLLHIFGDLLLNMLDKRPEGEQAEQFISYLGTFVKAAAAYQEEIPQEFTNYLELTALNPELVQLLLNLTYRTSYSLSDVRIKQLIDVLFQDPAVDVNIFTLLNNNMENMPSSHNLILQELLREREGIPLSKLFLKTNALMSLYDRVKVFGETQQIGQLLLTIIELTGTLGPFEECIGYVCQNDPQLEQNLRNLGFQFEQVGRI